MTILRVFLLRLFVIAIGTGIALAFPLDRALVARVALLVVCALALESLVRAAAALEPRRSRGALGRRPERPRPETLVRLENQVALAAATAADLHYHLRPVLREIAEASGAADEFSAGEAWELVRPEREPPRDGFARGISLERLGRVVDDLERT
jgi:hypothetical protein